MATQEDNLFVGYRKLDNLTYAEFRSVLLEGVKSFYLIPGAK
jgi:hypothetical protein